MKQLDSKSIFKAKSLEELNKLNTKNLLSFYRAERHRMIMWRESHYTGWEYAWFVYKESKYLLDILNEWNEYLIKIKSILDLREHVSKTNLNK